MSDAIVVPGAYKKFGKPEGSIWKRLPWVKSNKDGESVPASPPDRAGEKNGVKSIVVAVDRVSFNVLEVEIIAMLLLVSGVYYPVEVLPEILQKLAVLSPATYVLDGTRQAILEGLPTSQLWPYIWPTLIMGVIAIPLGLWVFNQAELYAKRAGKLHRNG